MMEAMHQSVVEMQRSGMPVFGQIYLYNLGIMLKDNQNIAYLDVLPLRKMISKKPSHHMKKPMR